MNNRSSSNNKEKIISLSKFSTLSNDLHLVVSIQTNHMFHSTSTQLRDYFWPIWFFSSLSPCRFFICGGKCHKPPSYVPYKGTYVSYNGTFGAPDQGQTLEVWGGIQQMSTLRWPWHSYAEKSSPQPGMKSCTSKDSVGGISAMVLDHMDRE